MTRKAKPARRKAKATKVTYDAATRALGRRLQSDAFDDRLELRDGVDPHFTRLWLDYAIAGLGRRKVLDERTRFLVMIGQFTMTRNADALGETIRAALAAKVEAREVLEVHCFQTSARRRRLIHWSSSRSTDGVSQKPK
jgi:hypothetical protein